MPALEFLALGVEKRRGIAVTIDAKLEGRLPPVVETTIYSVPRNQLLWAAVSETKNPKALQRFVEELVKESVKELHEQGLARQIAR